MSAAAFFSVLLGWHLLLLQRRDVPQPGGLPVPGGPRRGRPRDGLRLATFHRGRPPARRSRLLRGALPPGGEPLPGRDAGRWSGSSSCPTSPCARDRRAWGSFSRWRWLGLLSVVYAWGTYDLGSAIAGALLEWFGVELDGRRRDDGGGHPDALHGLDFLLGNMVSQPVAWLGLLGVFLAVGELLWRRTTVPQTLAYLTLLSWVLLLVAGSLTPLDAASRNASGATSASRSPSSPPSPSSRSCAPSRSPAEGPRPPSSSPPWPCSRAPTLVGARAVSSLESARQPQRPVDDDA